MTIFNDNLVHITLSGGNCNGFEMKLNRNIDSSVAAVKEKVFEQFGIPPARQRAIIGGSILPDSCNLKDYSFLSILVYAPAQTRHQTPEELLVKETVEFLKNEKGEPDLLSRFFTFFDERLGTHAEQFGKGFVYTPIPKDTYIQQIREIESCADEETSLACGFLLNVLQCTERSFHPLKMIQIYQDRMLFSEESARVLEYLDQSEIFQKLLEPEKMEKLTAPLSGESYADIRSTRSNSPDLRLFTLSHTQVLPLIQQALADQERFAPGKPFRFQCIVEAGHSTCLDLRINGSERSCVILDTVGDVRDRDMETLMKEFGFTVYRAVSTIPNRNDYQIRIAPAEGSLEAPKSWKSQVDFFKIEGVWHFRSKGNLAKIFDPELIQKLETGSLSLDELLQTDLDFPFRTLYMQKDTTSCAHFALHHAIRAGKTENLHELCRELAPEAETDRLLQRCAKNGMIPIRWHDLPSGFTKWSQSATFSDSNVRRDIRDAMEQKIAKRGVQTTLPETPAQRMRRFILQG